jgi:hypothetical protein
MIRIVNVLLLALAMLAASMLACDRPGLESSPQAAVLHDFGSVEAFQARFDADSAHPRLVLLLSPT